MGKNRLTAKDIDHRFLEECSTSSHGDLRIAGKMAAILERKLPEICKDDEIKVEEEGIVYTLSKKWFLVCRKQIIEAWKTRKPSFSGNCTILAVETILEKFGDRQKFNSLVKKHVDFDYYFEWFGK